jgi:alkyldihydroxyacetonephosphate synthase
VSYRQAPVFMAGGFSDTMEVAAPWSRLLELYHGVRRALGRHVLVMAHLSHAYPDGCSIYFTFAGSAPTDAACERLYDRAWNDALEAAVAAGGSLSHHHGIGRSKADKLGAELGIGVDLLGAVRSANDPAGIFNPGNLRPPRGFRSPEAAPVPPTPRLDMRSQLVHVGGHTTLEELARMLAAHGLGLGLERDGVGSTSGWMQAPIAAWLAAGAPGGPDPWLDPVDHLVAGYSVTLHSGQVFDRPPGPRRAVGPDLGCLFFGMADRVGRFRSAHLRVRGARTARPLLTRLERSPALAAAEAAWIDRTVEAAKRV